MHCYRCCEWNNNINNNDNDNKDVTIEKLQRGYVALYKYVAFKPACTDVAKMMYSFVEKGWFSMNK